MDRTVSQDRIAETLGVDTEHNPWSKAEIALFLQRTARNTPKMNELDLLLVRGRDAYSGTRWGASKAVFSSAEVSKKEVF